MTPILILLSAGFMFGLGWWLSRRGVIAMVVFLALLVSGLLLVWFSTDGGQQVAAAGTCGLVLGSAIGAAPATLRRVKAVWVAPAPVKSRPGDG